MRMFNKNNKISQGSQVAPKISPLEMSRATLIQTLVADFNNKDHSQLRTLLVHRFIGDFINLNFHKPDLRTQPENVLEKLLNTVTFYLKKQPDFETKPVEVRDRALELIQLPLAQLNIEEVNNHDESKQEDLALILRDTNKDSKTLYLSNRSSSNGEFRGAVLLKAFNDAKQNNPDWTLADLAFHHIFDQSKKNFLALGLFTFFSMELGEFLETQNQKEAFMQRIQREFPYRDTAHDLASQLLNTATNYDANPNEFENHFDRKMVLIIFNAIYSTQDDAQFKQLICDPSLDDLVKHRFQSAGPQLLESALLLLTICRTLMTSAGVKSTPELSMLMDRLKYILCCDVLTGHSKLSDVQDLVAYHQSIQSRLYEKSLFGSNKTQICMNELFTKLESGFLSSEEPIQAASHLNLGV